MNVPKDILDVLISPTTRCNLRCRYCYVDKTTPASVADMSLDDISAALAWLRNYACLLNSKHIRVTWFGGEPLLLGYDYLRDALSIQSEVLSGFSVVNSIQTNLTVDVKPFVPLFKRYFHNHVGFSVDYATGFRVFTNGGDSRSLVERNVKMLQGNGVSLGAVCTLLRSDIGKSSDIYAYFKKLGVLFRVNRAASSAFLKQAGLLLSVTEYENLVMEIADCYLNDPVPSIGFHNVDMMVASYLSGSAVLCVDTEFPEYYIGLEANGRITSRCRFVPTLGDYKHETPQKVLARIKLMAYPHKKPAECADCEFFGKVCIGGCAGESNCSCFGSDCGYRTEVTCGLWKYVQRLMAGRGLDYGSLPVDKGVKE
ncbi:MAG: radical SAM protein [Kiritimatiellae bacterium]|nr:radical SAM protein [Kiritimatiellia bacterium]